MTESSFVENPKPGKPPGRAKHIKMAVLDDLRADTLSGSVKEQVKTEAELTAGDSRSYKKLREVVKSHEAQVAEPETLPKILTLVHIAVGNVKRLLLDSIINLQTNSAINSTDDTSVSKFSTACLWRAVSYNTDFKSEIYNRLL